MTGGGHGHVVTVNGEIGASEMGITLSHDHLLVDLWGIQDRYDSILDDVELAAEEVRHFTEAGGGTIIDPTNIGIGRNPNALKTISQASGAHIVMGAGWYRERVYPRYVYETSTDDLAKRLVREFTHGVDDSGVRPGFIGEIGTERHHITPAEERVFRAAARAQRAVGCAILTHTTHWGELALEQIDLLSEEGVAPGRIIVSHLGDRRDVRSVIAIAARGVYVNIDNLAFTAGYAPLVFRADNVARLCSEGLASQVMLSNDICELGHLRAYGGPGYGNVIENFLPLLRERGVREEDIRKMTIENPARAFALMPTT